MTVVTQCHAVREVETTMLAFAPVFDVVSVEFAADLLTDLAGVVIPLEHGDAPSFGRRPLPSELIVIGHPTVPIPVL